MKKRVVVISLGGSQIIPDDINYTYLRKFKEVLKKHSKDYNFIIVCGGGSLARKYIEAVKKEGGDFLYQSYVGINATRANARFVSYFFGFNPEKGIPRNFRTLKKYMKKRGIVFCGALDYKPNQTSDTTSAQIASKLKAEFVNLTNVDGLYHKDPNKYNDAKFITKITWNGFDKLASKIKFKPGQHFVLDQQASKIIMKKRIPTFIMNETSELDKFLSWQKFKGTTIEG